MQLDPKERCTINDAFNHPAFQPEREVHKQTQKGKGCDQLTPTSEGADVAINKSRHFPHKGAVFQGSKPTESTQELISDVLFDSKTNSRGSVSLSSQLVPSGKDFSAEKKLVQQQMAAKEQDSSCFVSLTNVSGAEEVEEMNKTENTSSVSNVDLKELTTDISSEETVYSSAEIKPRNSVLQAASNSSSETALESKQKTNTTHNGKYREEDDDFRCRSKSNGSQTSHLVTANYSFFPGNEQSEPEQSKSTRVRERASPPAGSITVIIS